MRPKETRLSLILSCSILAGALAGGCTSTIPTGVHQGTRALLGDFRELAGERAIVLAGNPNHAWVAGMAGGHPTHEDAEREARSECERRRKTNRMRMPCLLYAVGDELVWDQR